MSLKVTQGLNVGANHDQGETGAISTTIQTSKQFQTTNKQQEQQLNESLSISPSILKC